MSQCNLLSSPRRTIILHYLKIDNTFLEVVGFVDGEADGDHSVVVPGYFVLFYGGARGAAAVIGGGRGGEVPFYVGGSADKGDVVEVNYLMLSASAHKIHPRIRTLRLSSNFGCKINQYSHRRVSGACGWGDNEPVEPWILKRWRT